MIKCTSYTGVFLTALTCLSACTHAQQSSTSLTPQLPMLIAHRGGTADFPENTRVAIQGALAHHVDGIWLSVQLSSDGIPVLYRPKDLSALTNSTGPVSKKTATELSRINAGWHFRTKKGAYPYRMHPVGIPTFEEALRLIPHTIPIFLDMKALPAEPQTEAVARVLTAQKAWSRVILYSTEVDYQKAFASYPQALLFESRDATRNRLFEVALTGNCHAPSSTLWTGFEMNRTIEVVERFTLGEGRSTLQVSPWTPSSVSCFRKTPEVKIMAFAVHDSAEYQKAACLGLDAVLVDSPLKMHKEKISLSLPVMCPKTREKK